jgi:hypothetical protein
MNDFNKKNIHIVCWMKFRFNSFIIFFRTLCCIYLLWPRSTLNIHFTRMSVHNIVEHHQTHFKQFIVDEFVRVIRVLAIKKRVGKKNKHVRVITAKCTIIVWFWTMDNRQLSRELFQTLTKSESWMVHVSALKCLSEMCRCYLETEHSANLYVIPSHTHGKVRNTTRGCRFWEVKNSGCKNSSPPEVKRTFITFIHQNLSIFITKSLRIFCQTKSSPQNQRTYI